MAVRYLLLLLMFKSLLSSCVVRFVRFRHLHQTFGGVINKSMWVLSMVALRLCLLEKKDVAVSWLK